MSLLLPSPPPAAGDSVTPLWPSPAADRLWPSRERGKAPDRGPMRTAVQDLRHRQL